MRRPRATLDERFWSKVRKTQDCWHWTAALDKDGYGTIRVKIDGVWKHRKAHAVSFFLHNGRWASPMVCHHCDNPSCVRPEHLFEGDAKSNSTDMSMKNRGRDQSKDFCINGHPRTEENSYRRKDRPNTRMCRVCQREQKRNRYVPKPRQERTHCKHGHEFTPENTRIYRNGVTKVCVECAKQSSLRSYMKKKTALVARHKEDE